MTESENIPRFELLGLAYGQYEELGLEWRFPCNPTFDELCDRAEHTGKAPIVLLVPTDEVRKLLDGEVESLTLELSASS